ncbi:VOC family protein [Goodfellowiella coeruleoviolacea]|uniref:Lactoylglutathione lyase n=1 Tax=Goodfellowiella coeruleoviolacea TaxID=334858 RepID=A0AAE3GIB5_9PSEU|nr:VOC family protein [Goodfellowiella coeruleoviolacea]MCP2167864.1 lactoylglutathione lyase [Goodfellowiella coeruleoviolacea]
MADGGQLTFVKVVVDDLDAQAEFYRCVLALTAVHRLSGGAGEGRYEQLVLAGSGAGPTVLLVRYPDRAVPPAGEVVLGFGVADVDEVVRAAVAAGGSVRVEPRALPGTGMRVAVVTDPEGHALELVQGS